MMFLTACGPAETGSSDGGAQIVEDAGQPDAATGPGPRFVTGPAFGASNPGEMMVEFQTDRPCRVQAAWRAAGIVTTETRDDFQVNRKLLIQNVPAGRSVELQISVFDEQGRAAGASLAGRSALLKQGRSRVLFDAAHAQKAGNADWIVDLTAPNPTPAKPQSESDWDGAYSAFGYELYASGRFEVSSLPAGEAFGSASYPLSGYDVVVIPEPNRPFSAEEIRALDVFVRGGGGLLLIGNHAGSDRDGDGFDAVDILNQASRSAGWGVELVGNRLSGTARVLPFEALGDGPFGSAEALGFFSGSAVRIAPGTGVQLKNIAEIPGRAVVVVGGALSQGRILLHGDSSGADDGSASGGNTNIFDAWGDPEQQNGTFFLNAVSWLAGEY